MVNSDHMVLPLISESGDLKTDVDFYSPYPVFNIVGFYAMHHAI